MRNLLKDADRDRLVAPLVGPLLREVALGGTTRPALAATEGSPVVPAEANARALELLLMPGVRDKHGALSDALLDLVIAMAEVPVPCRAAVAGGVELRRDDPRDFEALTPFWRFTGDLSRGEVLQAPRGAAGPVLRHTGNLAEFRLERHRACLDVEDAVTDFAVEIAEGRLVMRHTSRLRARAGWLLSKQVEAGTVEYRYEVRADSPVLRVTVTLAAARRMAQPRVTTALDGVTGSGLAGTAGMLLMDGVWQGAAPPAAPGQARWAMDRPVAQVALGAEGWPGAAPAAHLRPHDPRRVVRVAAEAREPGAVHWLLLRHGVPALAAGASFSVVEDRLLGAGAPPATAAAMAAAEDPAMAGLDLQPCQPSGAALNAVATALLMAARGAWAEPMPPARRGALTAFAIRQAERIEDAAPGIEDLAHAVMAADALRRAGLQPGLLDRLLPRLVARVAPDGVVRGAGLAGQALALLALARAATWPETPAAAEAAGRALGPVEAVTGPAGPALRLGGVVVDAAAEAEGVALLARAAGALVLGAEAGPGSGAGFGAKLPAGAVQRARDLHRIAINLLHPMARPRGGMLEVMAPGGVRPGLQAAATLAFMAPERWLLAGAPAPA